MIINNNMATKKPRVRVSKNRKRNWNKYCDIQDVENFLEEQRFNERIGGAVSDKTDEELYFIHTEAVNKIPENTEKKKKHELKCFRSIGSFSKVPCPVNINSNPYSKKINNVLLKAEEKRKKRLRSEPINVQVSKENIQKADFYETEIKDLWENDKADDKEINYLVQFRDEYTMKRAVNVPRHRFQKPSLLPAVEVPQSGASYNPSFEDHQELLQEALSIEQAKEKEELHLKRVLTDMFPTRAEAPTEESRLQEMSQGLFDESNSEDDQDDSPFLTSNPPVTFEDRIPKSLKRRKRERMEKERLRGLEKLQRKRLSDIYRIRSIKGKIREEDSVTNMKIEKRMHRKIDKMYQPKTLSKHKYEAPDMEVNLTGELCSSMRTLKTEGNILEDRYKSLQRRNIIEPRIKQKRKRRYKLKVQIKRSHRNFE